MCVYGRWITNKYTGHKFFVKCGHCKSCLQEKAVRSSNRIRREFDGSRIALFVTLTYDRISCPYIKEEDLLQHRLVLPIYRLHQVHRSARTGKYVRKFGEVKLSDVVIPPEDEDYYVGRYKWLKHQPHKIGVPYFKDFQNFIKRLRINSDRNLNYHEGFSIFDCSELGPKTLRPHFHFLLFIRPQDEAFYRTAILQAWPFASRRRTAKYIELARDPASYVASYVNCRKTLSPFFEKYFNVKHTFSRFFGTADRQFTLSAVLSKVDTGNLDYVVSRNKQGARCDVNLQLPYYVINRYFPKFKGYSRLTPDEISYHLYTAGRFLSMADYERPCKFRHIGSKICYSYEDLHKIHVRLSNAYKYYHRVTGKNLMDYAIDYERSWRCYNSNVLKRHWSDSDGKTWYEMYDNLYEVVNGSVRNDYLQENLDCCVVPLDPNEFVSNKDSTRNMEKWFDLYDKNRKITNEIMSNNGHYV